METACNEEIVIDETKRLQLGVLEIGVTKIKESKFADGKGKKMKGVFACVRSFNVTSGKEKEFYVGQGSVIDLDEYGCWKTFLMEEEKRHHGFIRLIKE